MSTSITIPKELPKDSALSYEFLRAEGIKTIQELAGDSWTDHNAHDPGITILEQLCYAITDLAYRLDYDIQDLLGDNHTAHQELFSPATILTNSSVTWSDLRKVVIDIKGVKNAWIEKVTSDNSADSVAKGLYKVIVEKDDLVSLTKDLKDTIKEHLVVSRNLCEDFEEINVLDKQKIQLTGTIEISDQTDNIHMLVADLLYKVQTNLSPTIRFYTMQELLDQEKRIDEIFEGPVLKHGFINDEELESHDRKLEIHASDLIKEMMDVTGVMTVQELLIQSGVQDGKNWVYYLDPTKTPTLNLEDTLGSLQFTVQGLKVNIDTAQVKALYRQKLIAEGAKRVLRDVEKDIPISVGKERNISTYYSLQNQFPVNYGIGASGLPDSTTNERKAQAKQLTAYLTFFDQLLANNFAQLAEFHKLVGFGSSNTTTYATQSLLGLVPGLEDVLVSKEGYETYLDTTTMETEEGLQRKNNFLNHMLARFGETFNTYAIGEENEGNESKDVRQKLIEDKAKFLQAYPTVSADRGKGFDYSKPYTKDDNCSGLEKRIALKLGIEETEQFLMVEHLLLRPHSGERHSIETYYQIEEITGFEAAANENDTKCIVAQHNLVVGEQIRIAQNESYTGIFTITKVSDTSFEINTPFLQVGTNDAASWQRTEPDLRHHLFSKPIASFEASPNVGHTMCRAIQKVQTGATISIVGANEYDGNHTVTNTTDQGFEIAVPFDQNYTSGRCMLVDEKEDRYSLQLSFVFPEEEGRYSDPVFQNFVENTICEETPVHLTTHIYWGNKEEIAHFTKSYHDFMTAVQQR